MDLNETIGAALAKLTADRKNLDGLIVASAKANTDLDTAKADAARMVAMATHASETAENAVEAATVGLHNDRQALEKLLDMLEAGITPPPDDPAPTPTPVDPPAPPSKGQPAADLRFSYPDGAGVVVCDASQSRGRDLTFQFAATDSVGVPMDFDGHDGMGSAAPAFGPVEKLVVGFGPEKRGDSVPRYTVAVTVSNDLGTDTVKKQFTLTQDGPADLPTDQPDDADQDDKPAATAFLASK